MKRPEYSEAFTGAITVILVILVNVNGASQAAYVPCRPGEWGDLKTSGPATLTVTVNVQQKRQTINNFGASDCWSIQYVGQWPLAKRQAIADLLFEVGLDDEGNPRGIGLSLWRFNIGAGSNRQSNISERWHRTDTFLSADYTGYNWSAQPGQRWFIQAAKERGVEKFLAFVNSPPINMTKNGRAYCDSSSGTTNLRTDKINEFAAFLSTIMQHFADDEGIVFEYLSPFNEPNWDWNGNSQEGCRYYSSDMKAVVEALYTELRNRGVSTQIIVPEAGSFANLYEPPAQRTGYIDAFFDQDSAWRINEMVAQTVMGHGYFSMWPAWDDRLVGRRETLRSKLNEYPGLECWMSEVCLWIPNESWVPPEHRDYGLGRDLGIDPALWVARTIHFDMTVGEATGWQWWLAVSPYDYKDGLVYVDRNDYDGNYYQSKMLWAMGNFSRFIRPGMRRVEVERSDNAGPRDTVTDLMVSAYCDDDSGAVAVVFVNWAYEDKSVDIEIPQTQLDMFVPYVTKGGSLTADNLSPYAAIMPGETIFVPARSIVTVVGLTMSKYDRDTDGDVDFVDFADFASHWGRRDCGLCDGADITGNHNVGLDDLMRLAGEWLRDTSMVAHWPFDETMGAIADDTVGPNDGELHGDPKRWPAGGSIGGALELDGVDDYVSTGFVLSPAERQFNVFAWVKGGASGQVVVSQTDGAGAGRDWLALDSAGRLMTDLRAPAGRRFGPPLVSDFLAADGQWHHIGLTWDGAYRSLWVDESMVVRDAEVQAGLVGADGGLHFGAGKTLDSAGFFNGFIDDIRICDLTIDTEP